ncbi:MAG TPA: tetratricopeptide repeat protein [Opitutaceae bacterium]|nr:tetratricopeptide repeat protein [Opitutaceae bacterium]
MRAGLVLAALAAYHNSFRVPFLYDDVPTIVENASIRHLWPLGPVLVPPPDVTSTGRPLVNFSLALNYALGGTAVGGYHALNLVIHLLAGLTLFGVVRRTLLLPALRERFGADAPPLALAVAAIWTLHPLQVEAVTYVVQRAESLMGLFYLLTLYCFVRGQKFSEAGNRKSEGGDNLASAGRPTASGFWFPASVCCCLLGMATKEVTVSAPLIVFLYDRTFIAGSFREAWRQRRRLYLGLAATWLPLAVLVASAGGDRNGAFSYNIGLSWIAYWLTQFEAVARYLCLSLWPHPLVFEYGFFWVRSWLDVAPYAPVVVALAVFSLAGLWRRSPASFLGAVFFAILAPTSLLPGTSQMIVEHRMYLPLAAVVAFAVPAGYALMGRRSLPIFLILAVALGVATWRRNDDFRSELAIWSDTVEKQPDCVLAHNSLGSALVDAHRIPEGIVQFQKAIQLKPDYPEAHYNLALVLAGAGRIGEAIEHYERSLASRPNHADTHNNLGNALLQAGRISEAAAQYQEAIRLRPDYASAHYNLGLVLAQLGRLDDAVAQYEEALRLEPGNADIEDDLGLALVREGETAAGIAAYGRALQINPNLAKAHNNLANAYVGSGRLPEAIAQYQEALRIDPDFAEAHNNLGGALAQAGRLPEAVAQFAESVRLDPNNPRARFNLGTALADSGRPAEAIGQFQAALRLDPGFTAARESLSRLQAGPGK